MWCLCQKTINAWSVYLTQTFRLTARCIAFITKITSFLLLAFDLHFPRRRKNFMTIPRQTNRYVNYFTWKMWHDDGKKNNNNVSNSRAAFDSNEKIPRRHCKMTMKMIRPDDERERRRIKMWMWGESIGTSNDRLPMRWHYPIWMLNNLSRHEVGRKRKWPNKPIDWRDMHA